MKPVTLIHILRLPNGGRLNKKGAAAIRRAMCAAQRSRGTVFVYLFSFLPAANQTGCAVCKTVYVCTVDWPRKKKLK